MTVPATIARDEALGREVFSSGHRRRARRSKVPHHVFLETTGETRLSVDRLDHGSPEELAAIGDKAAVARGRTFYGWVVVVAEDACTDQRQVEATPKPDNPYHADIVLPNIVSEDYCKQVGHAHALADISCWRDRPDPP